MKKDSFVYLETDFEKDLNLVDIPFSEYPRPQLRRNSYLCLNGKWRFSVRNGQKTTFSGSITVPFVPESRISGVMRDINKNDVMVYERAFTLEKDFVRDKILLHFGACDQYTKVFINNKLVGENIGGYLPFCFDITSFSALGENIIRVEVRDPLDTDLPYGKQRKKRGGMWYTPTSGIWQTVWLESVPENYIKSIKITPDLRGMTLFADASGQKTLCFEGKEYYFDGNSFRLDVENPVLWTPDNPKLYSFTLSVGEDKVSSYFALRTVSVGEVDGKSLIFLNGKPFFFHGLLDQGYFSDGIFLPASERGFKEDILKMKQCGFNMLRKHIKLEPSLFYYYCDKYGMLVFQDMINNGRYSFLVDTALPTVFLRRGIIHYASKRRRLKFVKTCKGIIENLYNHPSVVYYTVFNEGWGQYSPKALYNTLKTLDPTRVFDTTSGWFKTKHTDVESDHIYFKPVKLKSVKGRPMVLSEFGGYSCKIEEHSFNLAKNYGYKFFETRQQLENALVALYENEIFPAVDNGLCATVITQVSDVEDETNGLLTYDRRVLKVSQERMQNMSRSLISRFKTRFCNQ